MSLFSLPVYVYTNGPVTRTRIQCNVSESQLSCLCEAIKYLALKDIFYALFFCVRHEKKNCIKTKKRLFKN